MLAQKIEAGVKRTGSQKAGSGLLLSENGVRSFIIVSSIRTNSIVVINIFAPVTAIGDVIERACEFES